MDFTDLGPAMSESMTRDKADQALSEVRQLALRVRRLEEELAKTWSNMQVAQNRNSDHG